MTGGKSSGVTGEGESMHCQRGERRRYRRWSAGIIGGGEQLVTGAADLWRDRGESTVEGQLCLGGFCERVESRACFFYVLSLAFPSLQLLLVHGGWVYWRWAPDECVGFFSFRMFLLSWFVT